MQFKNVIVKPYWKHVVQFKNATKGTGREVFIFPTIGIHWWKRCKMTQKRYGEGRWEDSIQIMFMFLFWEISIDVSRVNYKFDY